MTTPPNPAQPGAQASDEASSSEAPSPEARRLVQRFAQRFDELRSSLQGRDPQRLAQRTGAEFTPTGPDQGVFRLLLWGAPLSVAYPDYRTITGPSGAPASELDQALVLYYFTTADGAALENRWIAFSDLPDGRFYNQAFQGYTGKELARAAGNDLAAFERACTALGGRPAAHADAAFVFQALPHAPLMAAYWLGDEDFPSTCQLLFDAAAGHYLPTDAYAILGSALTRRLLKHFG